MNVELAKIVDWAKRNGIKHQVDRTRSGARVMIERGYVEWLKMEDWLFYVKCDENGNLIGAEHIHTHPLWGK